MQLEGSCHCGRVRFRCVSHHPYPYQRCYCTVCRKTGGAGGYMINTEADAATLEVEGRAHVKVYRAMIEREGRMKQSRHERHFCSECGSHLWASHAAWPELIHPVASAIDTELSPAPENVHLMLNYKAPWVTVEGRAGDARFDEYPAESIAAWHDAHGLSD